MSADGGWRRLLPPRRRRPGLLAIVVRWRLELAFVGLAAAAWSYLGGPVTMAVAGVLSALAVTVAPVRRRAAVLIQTVIAPHRVRSALVQSGVTARDGSPPWLMWAKPVGKVVWIQVWMRSGTTVGDLRSAIPVIAGACGAAAVRVLPHPTRQDRATILILQPRWGFLGD